MTIDFAMLSSIIVNALVAAGLNPVQIGNKEYVIPCDDGTFKYVQFGAKASTDTKRSKAFDLDAAVEAFTVQQKKAEEKATKPKTVKGPSAADIALTAAVLERIDAEESKRGLTAQELFSVLEFKVDGFNDEHPLTWQKVSATCKALVNAGKIVRVEKDKKTAYVMSTKE